MVRDILGVHWQSSKYTQKDRKRETLTKSMSPLLSCCCAGDNEYRSHAILSIQYIHYQCQNYTQYNVKFITALSPHNISMRCLTMCSKVQVLHNGDAACISGRELTQPRCRWPLIRPGTNCWLHSDPSMSHVQVILVEVVGQSVTTCKCVDL